MQHVLHHSSTSKIKTLKTKLHFVLQLLVHHCAWWPEAAAGCRYSGGSLPSLILKRVCAQSEMIHEFNALQSDEAEHNCHVMQPMYGFCQTQPSLSSPSICWEHKDLRPLL